MNQQIKTTSPEERENLKLAATCLSLENINKELNEKFAGVKNKYEILKKLKNIVANREEKRNNLYYYEDGEIAALIWCLGLSYDTNVEELVGGKNV